MKGDARGRIWNRKKRKTKYEEKKNIIWGDNDNDNEECSRDLYLKKNHIFNK